MGNIKSRYYCYLFIKNAPNYIQINLNHIEKCHKQLEIIHKLETQTELLKMFNLNPNYEDWIDNIIIMCRNLSNNINELIIQFKNQNTQIENLCYEINEMKRNDRFNYNQIYIYMNSKPFYEPLLKI